MDAQLRRRALYATSKRLSSSLVRMAGMGQAEGRAQSVSVCLTSIRAWILALELRCLLFKESGVCNDTLRI